MKSLYIQYFFLTFAVSNLIRKAMTTILRIEHKDGCGIFRSHVCVNLNDFDTFSERHNDFPTPNEDMFILRYVEEDEFCAFKSIEQLQEWVTADEIKQFIKLNCKVLLIDVSERSEEHTSELQSLRHLVCRL